MHRNPDAHFLFRIVDICQYDRYPSLFRDSIKARFPIGQALACALRRQREEQVLLLRECFDQLPDSRCGMTSVNRHRTEPAQQRPQRPPEQRVFGQETYSYVQCDLVNDEPETVPVRRMRRGNEYDLVKIGNDAGRTLFLDDNPLKTDAAKGCGMQARLTRGYDSLVQNMNQAGITDMPA